METPSVQGITPLNMTCLCSLADTGTLHGDVVSALATVYNTPCLCSLAKIEVIRALCE